MCVNLGHDGGAAPPTAYTALFGDEMPLPMKGMGLTPRQEMRSLSCRIVTAKENTIHCSVFVPPPYGPGWSVDCMATTAAAPLPARAQAVVILSLYPAPVGDFDPGISYMYQVLCMILNERELAGTTSRSWPAGWTA